MAQYQQPDEDPPVRWTVADLVDPADEPYRPPGLGVAILLAVAIWVVGGFFVWALIEWGSR